LKLNSGPDTVEGEFSGSSSSGERNVLATVKWSDDYPDAVHLALVPLSSGGNGALWIDTRKELERRLGGPAARSVDTSEVWITDRSIVRLYSDSLSLPRYIEAFSRRGVPLGNIIEGNGPSLPKVTTLLDMMNAMCVKRDDAEAISWEEVRPLHPFPYRIWFGMSGGVTLVPACHLVAAPEPAVILIAEVMDRDAKTDADDRVLRLQVQAVEVDAQSNSILPKRGFDVLQKLGVPSEVLNSLLVDGKAATCRGNLLLAQNRSTAANTVWHSIGIWRRIWVPVNPKIVPAECLE
jgi:hypothetical protein